MYRYIIGQSDWEDYYGYEILHKEKYSEEQFLNVCREAFKKLDKKKKKEIADSDNSTGAYYIIKILIKDYGFVEPDEIISTVHVCNLHNLNRINCEGCSHSYYVNEEFKCNSDDCEYKNLEI